MYVRLCCLQEEQFRILLCTVDRVSFTDRAEERPISTFHKNYAFVKKALNPLPCMAIIWHFD
jgi:hypothetical protein